MRFILLLLAALAAPAFAQTPAPAAPAAPVPAIAAHTCKKPDYPGKLATDTFRKKWAADFRLYLDCLKGYVTERNAIIESQQKAARGAVDEFNASVKEYNDTVRAESE